MPCSIHSFNQSISFRLPFFGLCEAHPDRPAVHQISFHALAGMVWGVSDKSCRYTLCTSFRHVLVICRYGASLSLARTRSSDEPRPYDTSPTHPPTHRHSSPTIRRYDEAAAAGGCCLPYLGIRSYAFGLGLLLRFRPSFPHPSSCPCPCP